MPSTAITRPTRSGPAARVRIVMPSGISMPPPRPCSTRKATSISRLVAVAQSTEPAVKSSDREQVEPLGAEPVGRPAGQRDHAGQGQRVAGHRPGDLGRGGVELALEGLQRDRDDGDVEDRHDRAEHDDAGDHQDALVELVGVAAGRDVGGALLQVCGHRGMVPVATDDDPLLSFRRGAGSPLSAVEVLDTGQARAAPRAERPRAGLDVAHHPQQLRHVSRARSSADQPRSASADSSPG